MSNTISLIELYSIAKILLDQADEQIKDRPTVEPYDFGDSIESEEENSTEDIISVNRTCDQNIHVSTASSGEKPIS